MFEVKPMQDKPTQKKVCSLCGVEFLPEDFCYSVWDEGKFRAFVSLISTRITVKCIR